MKIIEGGVTSPKGFTAAGIHCGIRKNKTKKDLALVYSEAPAAAAAMYTQNLVCGAPIAVCKENLKNGRAQAIVCNSGIANTCNKDGVETAREMCKITANALSVSAEDIIVASTGVIGPSLDLQPIAAGMPGLAAKLSADGSFSAAEAIMTTDTVAKTLAIEFEINGQRAVIGGMAKGSGMINPNMATMLGFLTTDVSINPELLKTLLKSVADCSFNRVSVDGDTSTNDTLCIMANGRSGMVIEENTAACVAFEDALELICVTLAKMLAKDGEGATKLIECFVHGAKTVQDGNKIADSVINSPLVKTAMFGCDANFGRALCAIGYAGVPLDAGKIDASLKSAAGEIAVCESGLVAAFSEEKALEILKCDEIIIDITLQEGQCTGMAWGCDLSYDYVKINGDYRT